MSAIEFLSPPASVSMADEWFELATADHFWIKWRHPVLLSQLKRAHLWGELGLNVGCGHGLVASMVERDLGIRIDGCDLHRDALRRAERGKGRLLLYNMFDRNPEMLRAYDLLLLMDVIEHVEDDLEFIRVSLEHLKPGGIIAINVPAHMKLYSRYDEVAGHKRRYSVRNIRMLFSKTNVTPINIAQWGMLLLPALLLRKVILNLTPAERTISAGFVPANPFVRRVLETLHHIETCIPFSPPLGTSILATGRLGHTVPT